MENSVSHHLSIFTLPSSSHLALTFACVPIFLHIFHSLALLLSPALDEPRRRAHKERKWAVGALHAVYRRRYQLQRTALELFFGGGKNYFVDFGTGAARDRCLALLLNDVRPPALVALCAKPALGISCCCYC